MLLILKGFSSAMKTTSAKSVSSKTFSIIKLIREREKEDILNWKSYTKGNLCNVIFGEEREDCTLEQKVKTHDCNFGRRPVAKKRKFMESLWMVSILWWSNDVRKSENDRKANGIRNIRSQNSKTISWLEAISLDSQFFSLFSFPPSSAPLYTFILALFRKTCIGFRLHLQKNIAVFSNTKSKFEKKKKQLSYLWSLETILDNFMVDAVKGIVRVDLVSKNLIKHLWIFGLWLLVTSIFDLKSRFPRKNRKTLWVSSSTLSSLSHKMPNLFLV